MKVILHGNKSKNLEGLVKDLGFEIVSKNPDIVISYGGDGTMLSTERKYPGIPTLPIRNSEFCNKCTKHDDKKVLENLLVGKLKLTEQKKLHTKVNGRDLYALNDFVIRNTDAAHAIRFKVKHATPSELIIGDGIVIATPFGSTGYFKSITRETFTDGFSLAFNNTTKKIAPIYFDQDEIDESTHDLTVGVSSLDRTSSGSGKHTTSQSRFYRDEQDNFTNVEFELIRGKAVLTFDNSPEFFTLSEGTKLKFNLSDKVAKIYMDSSLRCPDCKVIRD